MKKQGIPFRYTGVVLLLLIIDATVRGQVFLDSYSSPNPVKIMPVGDSITDDCSLNGAWREPLQPLLETNGYPFTFVGRQSSVATAGFTKVNHEGYCGAVIAPPGGYPAHQYDAADNYLEKIVPDALSANRNPDVMLILIGANDINRGRNPYQVATNDMATLLGIIFSNAPNTEIGLAKITQLQSGTAAGTNVPIYNAVLQKLVNDRRALGQNIFLADMYSVVDYNTMFMADHIHPNATGLQAMAREWLTRIQTITLRSNLLTTVLINGGATWKYNDLGEDLGTNWSQPNYDDSGWSNGIARLGYGDSVCATTVSYGSQATNKNVTTYFRRAFVVPTNTVITNLNLRVAEADGVVVYLNGQEIYRTNLPSGPIDYTNQALTATAYLPRYIFYPTNVPVNLPPGTNWIAAEVHLSSSSAAATGFDMELIGTGFPGEGPMIGSFQLSVPASVNENAGTLSGQGMVIVSPAPTNDLAVRLRSSDTLGATVPSSVLIPTGQTNAPFDITVIDDEMVNTGRVAFISAYTNGYSSAQAAIVVHNTDVYHLMNLSIPASATEGDGMVAGSLNVSPVPTNDLAVNLTSSDTDEVTVPATVTIPAGQSNAVFELTIGNDTLLDGDQVSIITATAPLYTNAQAEIRIHDSTTATLAVTLPASASESAGTLTNAGLVSIGIPVATNFTVSLSSSDTSKLIVPATTMIANGQTSAVFNLTLVNSNIADVPQTVSVTAHVPMPNWTDGSATMTILDDAVADHFTWSTVASPQFVGEPFPVTVTAQDASNNTMDYRLPVTLSALRAGQAAGTNTILNSPNPENSLIDGSEYVLGYSITPNKNLKVTDVWSYFGDEVSIWATDGQLIGSQSVVSVPGTWVETPLPAPVILLGGNTYLVMVHENGVQYYWSTNLPTTFADGTINQSYWDYGNVYPTETDSSRWYFVDLGYATDFVSVPINPSATTNFSAGTWSGNMAVLQVGSNVMLEASSASGQSGVSVPFDVLGIPTLAISALTNSVLVSWPAAASGFNLEQSATLTNWVASSLTSSVVGDRNYVTDSLSGDSMYYRLHQP